MQNINTLNTLLKTRWPDLGLELECAENGFQSFTHNQQVLELLNAVLGEISVEHEKKLKKYAGLLIKWNKAYNLIGKSTEKQIHFRHLLDALQLIPHLDDAKTVLDIGSGAGLPAVPLAIVSNATVYACEPLQKRCIFLNQVKRELELTANFEVWNKKTQEINENTWQFDVITARAVAELKDLVSWGLPLLKPNGKFIFLKGEQVEKEIAELQNSQMTFLIKSSITNPNGKVVIIQPK